MTTRTNFILVDFENVQPKDIGLLKDGPFKVKVFLDFLIERFGSAPWRTISGVRRGEQLTQKAYPGRR